MTKVLDIANGEFVKFLTSIAYDNQIYGENHRTLTDDEQITIIWENSFEFYENQSLKNWLDGKFNHPNEYEIIYD